jgi:hypothetical protein
MKENLRVPNDVRQRNHQNSNDPVTEIQKPAADFLFPAKVTHDRKNQSGGCKNAFESGRSHLSENKGRGIHQGKF